MHLEVLTPEKTLYNGEIARIQLPGLDGSFELLNNHAPLVAALKAGKMKITVDKNEVLNYQISGGFIQTANNKTSVLLEGVLNEESEN